MPCKRKQSQFMAGEVQARAFSVSSGPHLASWPLIAVGHRDRLLPARLLPFFSLRKQLVS